MTLIPSPPVVWECPSCWCRTWGRPVWAELASHPVHDYGEQADTGQRSSTHSLLDPPSRSVWKRRIDDQRYTCMYMYTHYFCVGWYHIKLGSQYAYITCIALHCIPASTFASLCIHILNPCSLSGWKYACTVWYTWLKLDLNTTCLHAHNHAWMENCPKLNQQQNRHRGNYKDYVHGVGNTFSLLAATTQLATCLPLTLADAVMPSSTVGAKREPPASSRLRTKALPLFRSSTSLWDRGSLPIIVLSLSEISLTTATRSLLCPVRNENRCHQNDCLGAFK